MKRHAVVLVVSLFAVVLIAHGADGWSGGPSNDITDLTPNCAVCHSSVGREQLRTVPEGFANNVIKENRHYKAIDEGTGPYQAMSPADRQRLLTDVKTMDENASVTVTAPQSVRPGQEVQITAAVKGGFGVVGVLLLDTDLRYQARTLSADGWAIVGPPKVWGSDGQEQTRWIDRRAAGLKKNLNSAIIYDHKTDFAAKKFAEGKVTWTVRAPLEPGTYTVTVSFHYGTEKASPVGSVTTPTGAVLPKGGGFGPSGRTMLARPVTVTVR